MFQFNPLVSLVTASLLLAAAPLAQGVKLAMEPFLAGAGGQLYGVMLGMALVSIVSRIGPELLAILDTK